MNEANSINEINANALVPNKLTQSVLVSQTYSLYWLPRYLGRYQHHL